MRGSDDAVAVDASSSIAGQRPRPTTEQACPASPAIRRRRKAIVQYRQYPPIGPSASITRPTTERQDLSLGGLLGSPSRRFARAGSKLHKQHAAPAGRRSQATGPRKRANVEGGRTLSLSRKLPRFGSCATAVDEEGRSEVEGRGFLFKERREEACSLSIACPRPVRRVARRSQPPPHLVGRMRHERHPRFGKHEQQAGPTNGPTSSSKYEQRPDAAQRAPRSASRGSFNAAIS